MSSSLRSIIRLKARPVYTVQRSRSLAQARNFSARQDTKLCPNCSQPLPTPLPACTKCWTVSQIPSQTRYHDLFHLPYDPNPFVVDEALLKRQFRQSQSVCHPDTWASKGANKQEAASTLSSGINQAYQTLLNPLSRIEYILEVNGVPMSETDKVEDMEFLGDIMMAREEIQSADSREDLIQVEQENQERIKETMGEITQLVENKDWQKAKEAAIRLRYLDGIRRAAKEVE